MFKVSYMSDAITTEEITDNLIMELSKQLVSKGFIQTKINGNTISCSINAFE